MYRPKATTAALVCFLLALSSPSLAAPNFDLEDALRRIFKGPPAIAEKVVNRMAQKAPEFKPKTWSWDFLDGCIFLFEGPVGQVGNKTCFDKYGNPYSKGQTN